MTSLTERVAEALCDDEFAKRSSILTGAIRYPESQFKRPAQIAIDAVFAFLAEQAGDSIMGVLVRDRDGIVIGNRGEVLADWLQRMKQTNR